jgi:hypothetical protein
LGGRIYNAGDVNGDGKEDLAMATGSREISPDTNEVHSLYIYYGRDIPQATPDYTLNISDSFNNFAIEPLGDINNDGFDDLAMLTNPTLRGHQILHIILGHNYQQVVFIQHDGNSLAYLKGIGDVNNDGIDDFHLFYPLSASNFAQNKLSLYFGGSNFPDCDSLTICENTNQYVTYEACGIGDVNGDGISDFISDMGSTGHVWFGRSDLTSAWDISISPGWFAIDGPGPAVVYGDLNGDGFDDIIGSQYNYGGYSGNACIWLGKAQFNGTVDLYFGSPYSSQQFGWAKATGDFNNDGLCDLAISAPRYHSGIPLTLGYVNVYSGNTELRDTTVGNDDNIAIPASKLWAMTVYPNPIQIGKVALNLNLTGEGFKTLSSARITITNLKGQLIHKAQLTAREIQAGTWQSKQIKLSSGVYIVSIADGTNMLNKKKITIIK